MAGLAVGLDPALADSDKLPINISDTVRRARTRVAYWAYDHYASYPQKIREGFVAGAVAAVTCGLLRTHEGKPDGDFRYVRNKGIISKAKADEISRMMTNEAQFRALALIVSTKAQWWACNHHTGQSYTETTGFVKKTLKLKYDTDPDQKYIIEIEKYRCRKYQNRCDSSAYPLYTAPRVKFLLPHLRQQVCFFYVTTKTYFSLNHFSSRFTLPLYSFTEWSFLFPPLPEMSPLVSGLLHFLFSYKPNMDLNDPAIYRQTSLPLPLNLWPQFLTICCI